MAFRLVDTSYNMHKSGEGRALTKRELVLTLNGAVRIGERRLASEENRKKNAERPVKFVDVRLD